MKKIRIAGVLILLVAVAVFVCWCIISALRASSLAGVVTDPDGKPVRGASVVLVPFNKSGKTDAQGRFRLRFNARRFGASQAPWVLIARDTKGNLAGTIDLDLGATQADVQLEPAVSVSGRVVDPQGNGITNAEAFPIVVAGNYGIQPLQTAHADTSGRYELRVVPAGLRLVIIVSANGFGSEHLRVLATDLHTNEAGARVLQLEPVKLRAADQRVAGIVVGADDKPVSRAWVSVGGPGQPERRMQADSKGRFSFDGVCDGQVRVSANDQRRQRYVSAGVASGTTNVVMRLSSRSGDGANAAGPSPLKGKPLPDVTGLGLKPADVPAGQPLLVMLVDAEQRPSRRALTLLTEQAASLKARNLAVIVVEAGGMAEDAFAAWKAEAALPFPVGSLKGNAERSRATWGATALPWLILADKNHRVVAEGFGVDEVEGNAEAVNAEILKR
jgi:hypothetical protein